MPDKQPHKLKDSLSPLLGILVVLALYVLYKAAPVILEWIRQ
jgi:hypothetical protein